MAGAADSVVLEPTPDGLEVYWRVGATSVGTVVSSAEANQITRFIVRAAGLNYMIKAFSR